MVEDRKQLWEAKHKQGEEKERTDAEDLGEEGREISKGLIWRLSRII